MKALQRFVETTSVDGVDLEELRSDCLRIMRASDSSMTAMAKLVDALECGIDEQMDGAAEDIQQRWYQTGLAHGRVLAMQAIAHSLHSVMLEGAE